VLLAICFLPVLFTTVGHAFWPKVVRAHEHAEDLDDVHYHAAVVCHIDVWMPAGPKGRQQATVEKCVLGIVSQGCRVDYAIDEV